jgi:nickel-dependent lactate racemase
MINPSFAINSVVNAAGEAVDLFCGDWRSSHLTACESYAADHTVSIPGKRPLVIASCGGHPHDINMIQAHKTLEAASRACTDGGTIILLAECPDGLGRSDFLDWFQSKSSEDLAEKLCSGYQVNGQTAWSLLKKAERFDVKIVTSLDRTAAESMRLEKIGSIYDGMSGHSGEGYVLPAGAKYLFRCR